MTRGSTHDVPAGIDLVDFDPFGMELRVRPQDVIPELLGRSPGFMLAEGRLSAYVATYDHVRAVAKDHARFSSVKPKGIPGMERFDFFNGQPVMNYADPPEHTRRRRVVNASFTPRRIEQLDVHISRIVQDVLSRLDTGGVVDMVDDLCLPVSVEVLLGAFMNVAPEDRPALLGVLAESGALDQLQPGDPKPPAWLAAWDAGAQYCRKAIASARRDRTDNLIGLIAAAAEEGGTITDDEMMAMLMVLLTGGLGTTAAAAAAALMSIAQQPELKARIAGDRTLAAAAVDEAMRLYPPVTFSMRFATEDAEVGDVTIPAGTPVYVLWAAANHDPLAFPDPHRFDIDRPNVRSHVAFGFGVHNCIGSHVSRQVGATLIGDTIAAYPEFALADPLREPEFDTFSARGRHLAHLPMVLRGGVRA